MQNQYTITNVDPETSLVYVTYSYNGNEFNDRFPVPDITDANGINVLAAQAYLAYTSNIDAQSSAPTISADVSALFNVAVTQDQATQIAQSAVVTPPDPA